MGTDRCQTDIMIKQVDKHTNVIKMFYVKFLASCELVTIKSCGANYLTLAKRKFAVLRNEQCTFFELFTQTLILLCVFIYVRRDTNLFFSLFFFFFFARVSVCLSGAIKSINPQVLSIENFTYDRVISLRKYYYRCPVLGDLYNNWRILSIRQTLSTPAVNRIVNVKYRIRRLISIMDPCTETRIIFFLLNEPRSLF